MTTPAHDPDVLANRPSRGRDARDTRQVVLGRDLLIAPGDAAAGVLLAGACLGRVVDWPTLFLATGTYTALYLAGRSAQAWLLRRRDAAPAKGGQPAMYILAAVGFGAIGLGLAQFLRPVVLSLAMLYLAVTVLGVLSGGPSSIIGSVASGAGRAIGLLLGASAMGGMLCPPALLSAGLLLVYWAAAERLRMRQSAGQSLARPVVLFVLLVWMIDLQFLVVPGMPWQKLSLAFLGLAVVLIAWRTMLARGKGGTRPGAPGLVPPYRLLLPVQAAMALACPPPGWIVAMVLLLVWGGMVIRPLFGR